MKRQNDSKPVSEQAELQRQVESLRRDIRRLQLEYDLLKKANELLKKGLGVDLQLLSNKEKTLLVDALKPSYVLPELLVGLDLVRIRRKPVHDSAAWGSMILADGGPAFLLMPVH